MNLQKHSLNGCIPWLLYSGLGISQSATKKESTIQARAFAGDFMAERFLNLFPSLCPNEFWMLRITRKNKWWTVVCHSPRGNIKMYRLTPPPPPPPSTEKWIIIKHEASFHKLNTTPKKDPSTSPLLLFNFTLGNAQIHAFIIVMAICRRSETLSWSPPLFHRKYNQHHDCFSVLA